MSRRRFYITTAIPYVNGDPHLGSRSSACRRTCSHDTAACAATGSAS